MDPRTINSPANEKTHPYRAFEGTPMWRKVNRAIAALVKNGDIQETTRREYIVGYVCKVITSEPTTGLRRTRPGRAPQSN
jgi:hypothetical protein